MARVQEEQQRKEEEKRNPIKKWPKTTEPLPNTTSNIEEKRNTLDPRKRR